MVDIYIEGSKDETIWYAGSAFVVYEDNIRVCEKAWVTDIKDIESISNIGEAFAFIEALNFSLSKRYKAIRIHSSLDYIGNLVNKHKICLRKASEIKHALLKAVDDCSGILLKALITHEKQRKQDIRFQMCKEASMKVLYEKANEIEITSRFVLYTDGAYNPETGYYGAGVAIYDSEEGAFVDTIQWKDNKYSKSKKIAGCLLASMNAVEWCIDRKIYNDITIVVAYLGAASWVNDKWLPKGEMTKEYDKIMKKYMEEVNFTFRHRYRGHLDSNINKATKLAEEACGYVKYK